MTRPWSATTCEVCEGSGHLDSVYLPEQATWIEIEPRACWYCKGAGWYEAATS